LTRESLIMNRRTSPFDMGLTPEEVGRLNGWDVALTYRGEPRQSRLFVADLSHVPKWAFHGKEPARRDLPGPRLPQEPGEVTMEGERIVIRLTPAECLFLLLQGEAPVPEVMALTDMTDGYGALAVVGRRCFDALGKLSSLDMETPGRRVPFAVQGPVHDLRCVIVRLEGKEAIPGFIILVERGYGPFLLEILLDGGCEYGIAPAGWRRFESWLKE
jgi:sarcosine oxidase gamma subunit